MVDYGAGSCEGNIMKKLGLIANYSKQRAPEVLSQIWAKAGALGLELYADKCTAELLPGCKAVSCEEMFDVVDMVVALGGDGTMLRVVRELGERQKPVMGFNIGSLGFMTSVAEEEFDHALECIVRDDYVISHRAVLECSVSSDGVSPVCYRALNDMVIRNGSSSRVVTLDVSVDQERVNSYICDGLIVATPTGSTGHSLSAGGPILSPGTPAFVMSLICPHTLSSRPLVVADCGEIAVTVAESSGEVLLSVDGQIGHSLKQGDQVRIVRSKSNVLLANLPGYSYFEVLRQKLRWGGKHI